MNLKKCILILALLVPMAARAQYRGEERPVTDTTLVLTLDDALKIALSENVSVKVADMEVERTKYARKGSYGQLFPQISASGMYSYAIQKQKVYFGSDSEDEGSGGGGGMAGMMAGMMEPIMYYIEQLYAATSTPFVPYVSPVKPQEESSSGDDAIEMGRRNQVSLGLSASMPLVNLQLWESLRLTGDQVELAVEQARESRLGTVTSVKQAYYSVLMAKASYEVYNAVYENAVENCKLTERRHHVQKASDMDLSRAQASVAAAIPNLYNAENSITLALWQLKAVMGVDLDMNIDVEGELLDYADSMLHDITEGENASIENNSSLRQLALQAEQLATTIRMQKYAYLPSLSLGFAYSYNAMTDDFKFKDYHWTPYSYIGLSLNIPIFSGGQRYYAVKQAEVQATELDYQRINAERQLRIAIRQSLNAMDTAMKTYEAAGEALQSAEKAYSIAVKSYNVGRSTMTDLNDAQLILTQTQLQATQAIYSFLNAKAALEETLGYDFNPEE